MDFDFEPDDQEPIRPKSIVTPTDFSSRSVRFRLMSLFAMLVVVSLLMKEAGKPERWKWMGFEDNAAVPADEQPRPAIEPDQGLGLSAEPSKRNQEKPRPSPTDGAAPQGEGAQSNQVTGFLHDSSDGSYPVAAQKFWASAFEEMSSEQRRNLFRFLKAIRTNLPIGEFQGEFSKLAELLDRRRAQFHRQVFDELALMPDGTEEKTKLANELFESQEVWEKKIQPAFRAFLVGEDFTVSQLQKLQALQTVLDPLSFAAVQDGTTIGWEGDSTAWVRMWERVIDQQLGKSRDTTHLQMSSQPEFYRGKAVKIGGWVRSARQEVLRNSELGIPHYFILWVRPADTNLTPYCVYASELPAGFPPVTEKYGNLNKRIKVTGLFFKVRTYVDATGEVNECPVILAKNLTLNPEAMPLAVNAWQPSRATLITILVLIPLVATAIAWLVYWGTQSKRYQPGNVATERIQTTLHELQRDPRVQTDIEKIRELYQADANDD